MIVRQLTWAVVFAVIIVLGWMVLADAAAWEVEHRRETVESQTWPRPDADRHH